LLSCRQGILLLLLARLSLAGWCDPFWQYLREGKPGQAQRSLTRPSLMQKALLNYYQGHLGEAWSDLHQLEKTLIPGQQPPEFFWLRALLLHKDRWDLAVKNLEPLLDGPLKLEALSLLAQGYAATDPEQSRQAWGKAMVLAQEQTDPALRVRLTLTQSRIQSLQGRWEEALGSLLAARDLASSSRLPALVSRIERSRAEILIQLADWEGFGDACWSALDWARRSGESDEVESIAQFWVDQQLNRRSDEIQVRSCLLRLRMAEDWFAGEARLALLRSRARLEALGLNHRQEALEILERALKSARGRSRLGILADRVTLTSPSQRTLRRQYLERLMAELTLFPNLPAEDPLRSQLPRYGCWAALADTYLPDDPAQAHEYFSKALQEAPGLKGQIEVLNFQLMRYNAVSALPWSRKTLGQLLQLTRQLGADQEAGQILRSQMFALRSETRQLTRLFMADEIRPAPESPSLLALKELLGDQQLQTRLEQEIYQKLSKAKTHRETSDAYYARAELMLAQGRGIEALLALQRCQQAAQAGGWSLRQALALRMLADTYWQLGQGNTALEHLQQAEKLYRSSANSRDQKSAQECQLLKIYFLMRLKRHQEALDACDAETPWMSFLRGRILMAEGKTEEARQQFARTHFDEGLPEVGRLIFQARCSDPQSASQLYQSAYAKAEELGSLVVRDVALQWAECLHSLGSQAQAQQVLEEAGRRIRTLFQEYPPQVQERLLDQPATQQLLGLQTQVAGQASPRQSRRDFLARVNTLHRRYPLMDSTLSVSPSELVALQENLPAGRTLVQFFAADTDLYAMAMDSEQCRLIQVAVEGLQLEKWSETLRASLRRGQEPDEAASRGLYATLVRPLQIAPGSQVQVVPNGFFWYLPWDALQDAEGRFLVESYDFSCVSAAEFLRQGFAERRPQVLENLLSLGGVSEELPATRTEALEIAALFPRGTALLGPQANWTELQNRAPQAQILHLATHSALSSDLNQTYIELSDGRLSLERLYGLNLAPGALVVLSSCESALGQTHPGRDVASLASAFINSGAACVIATLWRVEDQASAEFFRHFYGHLRHGKPPSRALQLARRDCQSLGPSAWAAYQLVGDPGLPPEGGTEGGSMKGLPPEGGTEGGSMKGSPGGEKP